MFRSWSAAIVFLICAVFDVLLVYRYCLLFFAPLEAVVALLILKLAQYLLPVSWIIGINSTRYHRDMCDALWGFAELASWGVIVLMGAISGSPNIFLLSVIIAVWIACVWSRTRSYMRLRKPLP